MIGVELAHAMRNFSAMPVSRLDAIAMVAVQAAGLDGALVECGVWNGGSAAILAKAAHKAGRHVWLFDSWEGVPEPGDEDGKQARAKYERAKGQLCVGDISKPEQAFAAAGVTDNVLHLRKGQFADTLSQAAPEIGNIAILHIDADWYASVKVCLQVLYPLVVSGGLVIIDDYGHWQGCKLAVDEYFDGTAPHLNKIDYTSRYFFKKGE